MEGNPSGIVMARITGGTSGYPRVSGTPDGVMATQVFFGRVFNGCFTFSFSFWDQGSPPYSKVFVQYENPVYKERTPDIQIFQWTLDKTLRCVWLHPKVTDGGKLGKCFADSLLEFAGR